MLRRGSSDTFLIQQNDTQELRIHVGTWNVAGKPPPADLDLGPWLNAKDPADLYILGFQEIVPLNAGNVLGAEDDGPAATWEALIRQTLNQRSFQYKKKSYTVPPSPEREGAQDATSFINSRTLMETVACRQNASSFKLNDHKNRGRWLDLSYEQVQQNTKLQCNSLLKPVCGLEGKSSFHADYLLPRDEASAAIEEETLVTWLLSDLRHNSEDYYTRQRTGEYVRIASKQMVGLFITVWIRRDLRHAIKNLKVSCVGCGLMGYLGNKGSISVSMLIHQTSFCFVCAHLTSGEREGDELRRNADVAEILRRTYFSQSSKFGDFHLPGTILAHDRIIWLGDLNYRLTLSHGETKLLLTKGDWDSLLENDQLKLEQNAGRVFEGWQEGSIQFPPTYKYIINSDCYLGVTSRPRDKRRTPAWCDRILWFGKGLTQISYVRAESQLSDHRPVNALFLAEVEVHHGHENLSKIFNQKAANDHQQ
ncbi:hypothetical protein O6H91_11G115900 [Diphasiastrum complanatum]|nr:hypothetical protein O6H91_11G115900 [Diphasiastrum complanatum]